MPLLFNVKKTHFISTRLFFLKYLSIFVTQVSFILRWRECIEITIIHTCHVCQSANLVIYILLTRIELSSYFSKRIDWIHKLSLLQISHQCRVSNPCYCWFCSTAVKVGSIDGVNHRCFTNRR